MRGRDSLEQLQARNISMCKVQFRKIKTSSFYFLLDMKTDLEIPVKNRIYYNHSDYPLY